MKEVYCPQGYLGLERVRGLRALVAEVQGRWPVLVPPLDLLVIAKSVIASGCTALKLARLADARYQPRRTVVVGAFYSERGLQELAEALPRADMVMQLYDRYLVSLSALSRALLIQDLDAVLGWQHLPEEHTWRVSFVQRSGPHYNSAEN